MLLTVDSSKKKMQLSTVSLPKKELQHDPTNQSGGKIHYIEWRS